jgi:hypothetical protein
MRRRRLLIGLSGIPSVCAVGMAGQLSVTLGWEYGVEWLETNLHIHLALRSKDYRTGEWDTRLGFWDGGRTGRPSEPSGILNATERP